jgi:dual specificity phosphatase 9
VLLYDQGGGRRRRGEAEAEADEWEAESVLGTLLQKLREEGYLAYYLQGKCGRWAADSRLGDGALPSQGISQFI